MCEGTAGELGGGCCVVGVPSGRRAGHEAEQGAWGHMAKGLQSQPRISDLHPVGNSEAVEMFTLSQPPSS